MNARHGLIIADYRLKNSEGDYVFGVLEVCAKHYISTPTLYSILDSYNIPQRKRKFSQEFKLSVIREYLVKDTYGFTFTILQICDKFDIDGRSLYSFLHEFGIPLRNRVPTVRGKITVRKSRSSIKDLEYRISEIVADYNAEDRWGRVYTIKELCERYNTVSAVLYEILEIARSRRMYVSFRR
jgi:hypothetical protein